MTDRYRKTTLLVAMMGAIGGCGQGDLPDLAPVYGVVTLDGKPLANKEIIFGPKKGRPSQGVTDENGAYELQYTAQVKGAIIGHHVITITTPRPEGGDVDGFRETVPKKYNIDSILKAEVTSGRNKLDFELKSD